MPHIDVPPNKGREAWNELIDTLKTDAELSALPDALRFTDIKNRAVQNLAENESPLLAVVRYGGDIDRATISPVQHEVWDKFAIGVYVYDDGVNSDNAQEVRDYLTEEVCKALRKESVVNKRGPWYEAKFSDNAVTYHKVGNRVFAVIRFQTKARRKPGQ